MTKITVPADCGNTPKKVFLIEFNKAFATGNGDFIIDHISNNITWIIYGDKTIQGKEDFTNEMYVMKESVADELILESLLTYGTEGVVTQK